VRPTKIISGGQTGVDRAALDAAITLGIPHGGWCPRGRLAEDGPIPERYLLVEVLTSSYPARTRRNVEEADRALIVVELLSDLHGGTALTRDLCLRMNKPYAIVQIGPDRAAAFAWPFLEAGTLLVAGPRESKRPGIHAKALAFLLELLGEREPALTSLGGPRRP